MLGERVVGGSTLPTPITDIIRLKRDGAVLSAADITRMVTAITDGSASEGQAAAFTMAVCIRGMSDAECTALTGAMARSGETLDWSGVELHGPRLDKHSTGGVGDKVSLVLAPLLAACGAHVPMVSGRGLGHTGGTLDKLESIPGYRIAVDPARFMQVTATAGCAIVGASSHMAPADKRLYAIRDVTATVESLPLVIASILSKKLAANVEALIMDVKVGSGTFYAELPQARALAKSLVRVARAADLPVAAWITDMNQVLGQAAGSALEVAEAIAILRGEQVDERLLQVILALGVKALLMGRLASSEAEAEGMLRARLADGSSAERFAAMVHALGGPGDVVERSHQLLPAAPCVADVPADKAGTVCAIDVRALGAAIVAMGAGRQHPSDVIDHRAGIDKTLAIGEEVAIGQPLARVHAGSEADVRRAAQTVQDAYVIDTAGSATAVAPLMEYIA
ncbi:MAG: thymidine phosphorylase [Gammaproteobacteria bacterium]|nr:thymidine phosphorylase [Gammaproteobacteria bacterium]